MSDKISLQSFLPYRCTHLAEKISVSLSRIYATEFGVNVAQWRILATLAEFGEMQAKHIGEQTNMDKVRVSRAVANLLERELLSRRSCDKDSRAFQLSMSAAGASLYRQIVPRVLSWEQSLVSSLSVGEHHALFQTLAKLEAKLGMMEEKTE